MKNLTVGNLVKVTEGKYYGDKNLLEKEIKAIHTDSREITEDSLFIPIVGEKVDAHKFIPKVFEDGALCTLSEKKLENFDKPYILIKSSNKALLDIAEFYLKQLDIKVVGVTGSVGKTSTKEMIASVLSTKFNTLWTEGNFNNEIGLPLTVFRLTGEEDVAVLEMGISDFGEMSRLTKVARPDVAVITNIGTCHLENLKSRDGVLKAKTEIFEGLKDKGKICINGDDDKLKTITSYNNSEIIFYGKDSQNAIYAQNIENMGLKGTRCEICTPEGNFNVRIYIPGVHMVYNALAACSAGLSFSLTLEEIKEGIEDLKSIDGRLNIIETEKYTIMDDCYNSNPVSMMSSIDILGEAFGRKVCILGDMFELGEDEAELHKKVGVYVKESKADVLITVGNLSRYINEGAADSNVECVHFDTKAEAFENLEKVLKEKDSILVKASHGMEFNEIVEFLKRK